SVSRAYQQLDAFGGRNGGRQVYGGVQDSGGLTGFEGAVGEIRKQAGQAGCLSRQHVQSDAVAAHCRSVDQGEGHVQRNLVEQVAVYGRVPRGSAGKPGRSLWPLIRPPPRMLRPACVAPLGRCQRTAPAANIFPPVPNRSPVSAVQTIIIGAARFPRPNATLP